MRLPVLLLAALCGCGGGRAPDEVYRGARLYYDGHVYPDAHAYVDACIAFLGRQDLPVYAVFVADQGDLDRACGGHVAGCRYGETTQVWLRDAPIIWETALCHEAIHVLAGGDAAHHDPIWRRLSEAGLDGQPREP